MAGCAADFKETVIQFLEAEALPGYEQWEADKLVPREFWLKMGANGLLLPDMPEAYGGLGADIDVPMMIMEEMCRLNMHGLASAYNIHSNIIGPYINNMGSEEQKSRWLPPMVRGEVVAALAMTEPGGGSDTAAMRTQAVREDGYFKVNGSKTFITNGSAADLIVLCCKTDPKAGAKGISLLLVETKLEGFQRGKQIEKIGQHCSDTAELFFDDVRVPENCLLGQENRGFIHMMEELPRERLGCAIQAIGHMQGALDLACDYVQERTAFGATLSRLQNTRFKLAECKIKLELSRAYYEKCLSNFRAGTMTVTDAAMLKYASTEYEVALINECLQHFGGYGYTDEYPISRFYRDARVQTIYAGSSEIMLELVARSIVGK